MKHILSTITVFFILITSSVSWSEEVGYGDLRIGSDRSVIDEHCEVLEIWSSYDKKHTYTDYQCYGNKDIKFSFMYDDDEKIIEYISLDFGVIYETKLKFPFPIDEILTDPNGKYFQIRKRFEHKYQKTFDFNLKQKDGFMDWVNQKDYKYDYLNTFYNNGSVTLALYRSGDGKVSLLVMYDTEKGGLEYIEQLKKEMGISNFDKVLDKL